MESGELRRLAGELQAYDGPALRVMEVCGTQTHENYRLGIRSLLPPGIRLVAGPGCPVCVTPADYIDRALWLAGRPDVTVCSFGDLLRVPGGESTLALARAQGADVRVVYSPLDALELARQNTGRQIVFLAVGFETTVPSACLAVEKAARDHISNFSLLCACKTMERAYYTLADRVDAFLYPGHVAAITGMAVFRRLAQQGVSGAVSGFTAGELLTALLVIARRSGHGAFAINAYPRVVAEDGNPAARALMERVMEPCDARWRGLGNIPGSGLRLRETYAAFDAAERFGLPQMPEREPAGCHCGEVLRGELEPAECSLFGRRCTPEHPVGACMVSGEGACAACYKYGISAC